MPRIRSVKPEFWTDRKLASRVSRDARLLYISLWNFADEHARLQGDARFIKGQCFPYDDDLDLDDVVRLLGELVDAGRIQRYEHDGDPYIYLPKLPSHQRLEAEKVPSRLPQPPDGDDPNSPGPDDSAPRANKSAPDNDESPLSYVAGSREQVAGSRDAALPALCAEAPDDPTGQLIAEHAAAYSQVPPPSALVPVKREVMRLVAENVPPDRIRAGLARMREKRLAASLLPQLVTETAQPTSTTDARVAAGLALVDKYREAEGA
jgi:hypothetical protein